MRFKKRNVLLAISIVAFLGVVAIIWQSLFSGHATSGHGICPRMIPNYFLWLSLILMVVVIVPISYYVVSRRLEEKMERSLNTITKLVDHRTETEPKGENTDSRKSASILKLLNQSERKVMEKILENKGEALQSEISRIEGMSKLKAHRAVKDLERKDIISLEPYSKTNRIVLNDDIRDIIS